MGLPNLIERIKSLPPIPRMITISAISIVIGSLLLVNLLSLFNPTSGQGAPKKSATAVKTTTTPVSSVIAGTGLLLPEKPVSPWLFGTNLSLRDDKDQVVTSPATRKLLKQVHATIIRIPVHPGISKEIEVQAVQIVKDLGAIPLISLPGAINPDALAEGTRIIEQVNKIFSNTLVYYEFGNEDDLLGVSAESYAAAWNSAIPKFTSMAPYAHFIGPVNYSYNSEYLVTFLKAAKTPPNEVSWHEYTCTRADTADTCLANIDQWSTHITHAREAMKKAIGRDLPIMITEWNYAPDANANDGKRNDDVFMSIWTLKAIKTLAANNVFASMQYSCTNSPSPLISEDGTLTAQGAVFQSMYELLLSDSSSPPVD